MDSLKELMVERVIDRDAEERIESQHFVKKIKRFFRGVRVTILEI
jgi:hypothetical protein